MKKFLSHEISAIKSDFREHPILSFFQYSAILLVCAVVLYILFNDKYHFESKALLILAIILLCSKVKRLENEIFWKDSHIKELKQENQKIFAERAALDLELYELKAKLQETNDLLTEETIASARYRSSLSLCAGEAEVKKAENKIEKDINRHRNTQYFKN